jgi:uncharacterized membrane protein
MSYEDTLTSLHLTQEGIEGIILFCVLAIGIGYVFANHFREVVLGVFAMCILLVFAHHESNATVKHITTVEQTDKEKFMEDCVSLTHKEDDCEDLWKQRQEDGTIMEAKKL